MTALIKQEHEQILMGEGDSDVFFSLEDEVKETPSKPVEVAPTPVEEEQPLEDVEILDAEIVMQATGDYTRSNGHWSEWIVPIVRVRLRKR